MRFCVLLICMLVNISAFATIITGRVTNISNEPLAFANVYVKGSTNGTTTNIDGYYKLEVAEGDVEIVFRYIGYKLKTEPVRADKDPVTLNVQLEVENYTLSEVTIKPTDEDPAYGIIRQAIAKRKFYRDQVDEFSCNVYIKGVQKITKHPEKFMGVEVDLSQVLDNKTGIIYLSESVSKYHFKKPDKVKEEMISSKVSGSNKAFSFNQASDMEVNFYDNMLEMGGLNQRGFVSPIANNALFYYKYKLEGSYFENGRWVNRIAVFPKRKSDPAFSGFIYIQSDTWRIHSTDLYLTKDSQMEFVDTIRISQTFVPVNKEEDVWLQGSMTLRFYFSAFGFEGNGNYVSVHSGYKLTPVTQKKFYTGAVMKVNEDANKKDSVYWETIRPIPLTTEEIRDYVQRDSILVIKESKPYKDSLDRKSNKFKAGNLIQGYVYTNRYQGTSYTFSSMLSNIQYNTVEGLNAGLTTGFRKKYEKRKNLETQLKVRYGISNEKVSGSAFVQYEYEPKKFSYIRLEGGDDLVQFNEDNPITPFINSFYTLLYEKNYMKLFHKQYGKLKAQREVVNGIRLTAGLEYSARKAVTNTTDYTFNDIKTRAFTSNNPIDPDNDNIFFNDNVGVKLNINARINFFQKYVDRPDFNYLLGSKYPELTIIYEKGLQDLAGSDVDYDRIEGGVEDEMSLGILGTLEYYASYGKFLNSERIFFMDAAHFNGNQTVISGFDLKRFDLLEYYKYSTSDEYIQVFAEHSFGGFILNKIPLIRKLKLNEIAGFRYLHVPGMDVHYEFSFGLEKLGFIRADIVTAVEGDGKMKTGFVLGLKGTF